VDAMKNKADEKHLSEIREEIRELCKKFPIPESFV